MMRVSHVTSYLYSSITDQRGGPFLHQKWTCLYACYYYYAWIIIIFNIPCYQNDRTNSMGFGLKLGLWSNILTKALDLFSLHAIKYIYISFCMSNVFQYRCARCDKGSHRKASHKQATKRVPIKLAIY